MSHNYLLSNSEQIREADRIQIQDYQFPGILLMEEAGKQSAERIAQLFPEQKTFLILAGPGNNGGDGLVIARYLHLWGKEVKVWFSHSSEKYQGDAKINFDILSHLSVEQHIYQGESYQEMTESFSQPPLVVDALLGTGIQSKLRGTVAELISMFADTRLKVVAVDLPSGLNADTGELVNEVIPADVTLTFQLPKICQFITPASEKCGKVEVIDIGIWPNVINQLGIKRRLIDSLFVSENLISRKNNSHKGSYGHVLLIGGSSNMSGAISMAARAAVRSGVGLCTVYAPALCQPIVLTHAPEAMCIKGKSSDFLCFQDVEECLSHLKGKTAVVIGPGLGWNEDTRAFFQSILPYIKVPLLIDADALNLLSESEALWANLPDQAVITPHPGEMKRLMPEWDVQSKRLEGAEQLAVEKKVVVVLKGAGTIVSQPDGVSMVNTTGNPGMATGGAGDVLSGMIGALLAQGYRAGEAAAVGVWLHGRAGDEAIKKVAMAGLTAMRLIECIHLPD
ncbi:MAG: NAD(P)H-hydrate dehydratase [Bacteroidetes bacterium]|nr:NAD(P)H-hydrate dehydratase [Bacteroidota bacterium]